MFNLQESRITLQVISAPHIKQMPGRGTDVKGYSLILQLLLHDLLRSGFVPLRSIWELLDLPWSCPLLIRKRAT